jgi:hypothetical protein
MSSHPIKYHHKVPATTKVGNGGRILRIGKKSIEKGKSTKKAGNQIQLPTLFRTPN